MYLNRSPLDLGGSVDEPGSEIEQAVEPTSPGYPPVSVSLHLQYTGLRDGHHPGFI